MATDDAVELAPDAQDGEDPQDDESRVEAVREWARRQGGRIPRPTTPTAQDALYAYTVLLLLVAPAVAVVGIAWVALSYVSLPAAVAVGGVSATIYALFLTGLIMRYEAATVTNE
jgi:hypothetical protein